MHFMILSHTNNNNIPLAEKCQHRHFSPLSSFSLNHHGNVEARLTLALIHYCSTVFETDSKPNLYISKWFLQLTPNLATPEVLSTWYECSYDVGSEIIIGLSDNFLECKYYEHFGPGNFSYIIIATLQYIFLLKYRRLFCTFRRFYRSNCCLYHASTTKLFFSPSAENFGLVMNQLVTDLSSQDNLNQPCSELTLLPPLCHHDDLLLIGPALHDTDHRYIEEQVMQTDTAWTFIWPTED